MLVSPGVVAIAMRAALHSLTVLVRSCQPPLCEAESPSKEHEVFGHLEEAAASEAAAG